MHWELKISQILHRFIIPVTVHSVSVPQKYAENIFMEKYPLLSQDA